MTLSTELFSRFKNLAETSEIDEKEIRSAIAEGKSAAEARRMPMCGGPLGRWYSVETDGWEEIFRNLLTRDAIIVQVGDELYPMHLEGFRGCFS